MADVHVLTGLWQFIMIQGTQLPKEMGASIQQSHGGSSQYPHLPPPEIREKETEKGRMHTPRAQKALGWVTLG